MPHTGGVEVGQDYANRDGDQFKAKETTQQPLVLQADADTSVPKELQQLSDVPDSPLGSAPQSPVHKHKEFSARRRSSNNPSRLAEAKKEEVRLIKQNYKRDSRRTNNPLALRGNVAMLNQPLQTQKSGGSMPSGKETGMTGIRTTTESNFVEVDG